MESQKLVYGYHATTGVFTGAFPAQIDPLETQELRRQAVAKSSPRAMLSVEGGEPFNALTEEGREKFNTILDQAKKAKKSPLVSINGGDPLEASTKEFKAALDAAMAGSEYEEPEPVYLMPANATDVPPPEAPEGQVPVMVGGEWELRPDVLGKVVYEKATRYPLEIRSFDDYDPEAHTLDAPAPFQKWGKNGWVKDEAALWAAVREKRTALLAASDWTQLPDSPLEPLQRTAWAAYRAALRDITEGGGNPENVEWPAQPE